VSYPLSTVRQVVSRKPRKYTDLQLADAMARSDAISEVLRHLGLVPSGGNYESVKQRAESLGLDLDRFRRQTPLRCTDDEVSGAVRSSRSLAQVLRALGVKPGGNQARLKARIEALGLDTSHFVGGAWRRGMTTRMVPRQPLRDLLVEGRLVRTNSLKARLILEGLKARRCETCLMDAWNGLPIPLELDHINGRRTDNRLANLRILCPNCHAQTDTYRGRNIGASDHLS